jgi:hypothetical protein
VATIEGAYGKTYTVTPKGVTALQTQITRLKDFPETAVMESFYEESNPTMCKTACCIAGGIVFEEYGSSDRSGWNIRCAATEILLGPEYESSECNSLFFAWQWPDALAEEYDLLTCNNQQDSMKIRPQLAELMIRRIELVLNDVG